MDHLTLPEKKALVLEKAAGLPSVLVIEHVIRLDSDYFNEFSVPEILEHLQALSRLSSSKRFVLNFAPLDPQTCGLAVIGEDLPGFFAALSGLLAGYDLDIQMGKVFTYQAAKSDRAGSRKIIDYLVLEHPVPGFLTPEFRGQVEADLLELTDLLRAGNSREVRRNLYRRVGEYLSRQNPELENPRLPVEVDIDADGRHTIVTIRGTDHKALLFSLSNALSLQGVHIHKLLTRSANGKFEDRIFIFKDGGGPITDARALNRVKVAIVLMERFISALPQASDYPSAVESFNAFIDALTENTGENLDLPAYEDFTTLSSLAKILSAGPFLWEEMLKLPFSEISRLLLELDEEKKTLGKERLGRLLEQALAEAEDYAGKYRALNRFKDFQLFRLDVVHLVFPHKTLEEFSGEISDLAEVILETGFRLAFHRLREEYGVPRAGTELCPYALVAQGKLGGRELGYASDLEIQLVYGASGETDHPEKRLSNAEFFSRLMLEMRKGIAAKAEGIFALDLRLRPHGESGPLASNLDLWFAYYAPGGQALDYERQALIKLRPLTGTPAFLEHITGLRDALIYGGLPIGIDHTLELREKQIRLKVETGGPAGKINAKYSRGGLVEVEYTAQFLQLRHGGGIPALRQPNTEAALEALLEAGMLTPAEFEKLFQGYAFLRRLINALRMARGHSRDLVVPPRMSDAFQYLAKRMGYLPALNYAPDSQLDWDLNHVLQDVHAIFSRHFLGIFIPGSAALSFTGVLLSSRPDPEAMKTVLTRLGLQTTGRGENLLRSLLSTTKEKGILCAALVVAEAKLRNSPDPESVLLRLGQYLEAVPRADYFVRQMLDHPFLLEILFKIFGHSEYLTQILLRRPDYLHALGDPATLGKPKLPAEFRREMQAETAGKDGLEEKLEALRGYRNREYLRIGLRDIYLDGSLPSITAEISLLTNNLVDAVFDLTLAESGAAPLRNALCAIALGKLGGGELNYSSDIDIVFVIDSSRAGSDAGDILERWARSFISALSSPGTQGKMFRVDVNLRPYGGQGALIASLGHYENYYRNVARGWELQAWLKARPIAGDLEMGRTLVMKIQALAVARENRVKIESSMREVRLLGLGKLQRENRLASEVKLGPGGIRTIEFYVQYRQILEGSGIPELITGNTLEALGKLYHYRLLSQNYYELLSRSYLFLRRVEHRLQLQGLRQRHELPASPEALERLARRMGFEERLGQSAAFQFRERYRRHMLILQDLSSELFGYDTNLPRESSQGEGATNGF